MRTMRTLISSSAVLAVALTAAAPAAIAQAPRGDQVPQNRFCRIIGTEGQARCAYQTLGQCERSARRGAGDRCFDRTYMLAAAPSLDTAAAPERPLPRRVHVVRHRTPLR
jgi:hypothetical protein